MGGKEHWSPTHCVLLENRVCVPSGFVCWSGYETSLISHRLIILPAGCIWINCGLLEFWTMWYACDLKSLNTTLSISTSKHHNSLNLPVGKKPTSLWISLSCPFIQEDIPHGSPRQTDSQMGTVLQGGSQGFNINLLLYLDFLSSC